MSGRRRITVAAAVTAAAAATAVVATREDDDRPVDPRTPEAREAAGAAREIVRGEVVEVAVDRDNGKWEVTIARLGRRYEVELDPVDLALLRLDYD